MNERANESMLIESARNGSAEAIAELHARYGGYVYRVSYRLIGIRQDAEDVVQELFVGLPHALRSYEDRSQFQTWLGTLTARSALMRLRQVESRQEVSLTEAPRAALGVEGPDVVGRIALDHTLKLLPDLERQVFILKVMEGYTHAEVARLLGVSSSNARTTLHRAREKLARLLRYVR